MQPRQGSCIAERGGCRYLYLSTGLVGETVTDVSQRLLAEHGGLRGLFQMDVPELARIRGLGDAKTVRLEAALELGRLLDIELLDHLIIGQGRCVSLKRLEFARK